MCFVVIPGNRGSSIGDFPEQLALLGLLGKIRGCVLKDLAVMCPACGQPKDISEEAGGRRAFQTASAHFLPYEWRVRETPIVGTQTSCWKDLERSVMVFNLAQDGHLLSSQQFE